ncbi:hypothetical protein C8R47DRAFT_1313647 [Mycena vitilis]|nr:hypothetical protein C8R47DRAFT_1313647 [Mycena vitilis]
MGRAYLPAELLDSVMDGLEEDKPALLTCSLVSKQWLPRTRYHCFSSVTLLIKDEKNPAASKEIEKVHGLLSLLESPVTTLVPYVTEIHLLHRRERRCISAEEILTRLDASGIRPAQLTLNCSSHFTRSLHGAQAFASSLQHLNLQLSENTIHLHSVVDYICAFPFLESLTVDGRPSFIVHQPAVPRTLPAGLHTIRVGHPLIVDWILTLDPLPSQITTVHLVDFGCTTSVLRWHHINAYFESPAAAFLESLTFTGITGGKTLVRPGESRSSLHHLRCLKHLTIKEAHESAPLSLLDVLASLRKSPSSATLETITVSQDFIPKMWLGSVRPPPHFRPADWLAVDAVLADASAWPRLCSIVLTTCLDDHMKDYHRHEQSALNSLQYYLAELAFTASPILPIAVSLKQHLPRCGERGIVSVAGIPIVEPKYHNA